MNTPLQSTSLSEDQLEVATAGSHTADETHEAHAEGEAHIHLPNPSYWPLLVGIAVLIIIVGVLISHSTPVLIIIGFPILLITDDGLGA